MSKNFTCILMLIALTGFEKISCENVIISDGSEHQGEHSYVPNSEKPNEQPRQIIRYTATPIIKYIPIQVPAPQHVYAQPTPQHVYAQPTPPQNYKVPVVYVRKPVMVTPPKKYYQVPVVYTNGHERFIIRSQLPHHHPHQIHHPHHPNSQSAFIYPVKHHEAEQNQDNGPRYTVVNYVPNSEEQ